MGNSIYSVCARNIRAVCVCAQVHFPCVTTNSLALHPVTQFYKLHLGVIRQLVL